MTGPAVRVGLISAGSHKRLAGESGEDCPAFVTIEGRPMLVHVLEQALASNLERIYVWTLPQRVEELRTLVDGLAHHGKIVTVVPARQSMFESMTNTIREYVTPDLFGGGEFPGWREVLEFTAAIPEARDTTVLHISSDAPLIRARDIDEFCAAFDPSTTDYCIGVTRRETVTEVLNRHQLFAEFEQLQSTIKNFTKIATDDTHLPLSIRINNLHIVKPYLLQAEQYDFFGRIFNQRKVSKLSRWFKLAGLIRSIFTLPWLNDDAAKRDLYSTVWHLVRSQERLPALIRRAPSQQTSVSHIEKNISFLMSLRSRIYLDGRFGSYFDADAQEEYDFLRAHFATLAADPDL